MNKFIIFLTLFSGFLSFSQTQKRKEATIVSNFTEINLKKNVGKKVTIIGKSINEKIGATVTLSNGKRIYIADFESWPKNYYLGENQSKLLKVTGILVEDYSLPVYELSDRKNDSLILVPQAIQIPKGSDLKRASHRFLLKNVSWEILKN